MPKSSTAKSNANKRREGVVARVYHIPVVDSGDPCVQVDAMAHVLDHRNFHLLRIFRVSERVGIMPCRHNPSTCENCIDSIAGVLSQRSAAPFICDTTCRYRDIKTDAISHIQTALEQSRRSSVLLPHIVLDGILGNHEVAPGTHKAITRNIHLAGELQNLAGLVSLSIVQEHRLAGISGAMANLGVGLAAKRGKIRQHAMHAPEVNMKKCHRCRQCIHHCPVKAIYMGDGHVEIDTEKCINCGRCVEVAKYGGINYAWDATPEHYQREVTAHAAAALQLLCNRVICINILRTGKNAGLIISRDPVAADAAALALLDSEALSSTTTKLGRQHLQLADQAGLGSTHYHLERIAY